MKNLLITSTILATLLSSTFAYAESVETVETAETNANQADKQWSVGIGSYALVIDDEDYGDDEFTGLTLSSTYAFSDEFAMRGSYYSLEHDDWSALEVTGFDIVGYWGTGLMSEGFKAYIGGGVYHESLEVENVDESFSGAQLNGGIGYNWESVALDLSLGIRTVGDYEDFADDNADLTAVTSSLTISYRF
mgnify:CR=1 FL=1